MTPSEDDQGGGNWDPKPSERTYYRDATTGDLGWLVRRNGVDQIKLDRPLQDIIRPFKLSQWRLEEAPSAMTTAQAAQVAFSADCRLCHFIGKPNLSKREWINESEEKRIAFMNEGPAGPEVRKQLYRAIMDVLGPHAR